MTSATQGFAYRRGQRTDLHIATLRQDAENTYGQLFAQAVRLRRMLDGPSLADAEYDAEVIAITCNAILTIRPLPSFLRAALGGLLGIGPDKRAKLIKVNPTHTEEIDARSDHAWVELVITALEHALYAPGSYLAGLTDIACGFEGLPLTWSRDVIGECDRSGVISVEAVGRIRQKFAFAIAGREVKGRTAELIGFLEHALSIGSPLICIPSHVREDRVSEESPSQTPRTQIRRVGQHD